jgi:predicted transposase/invertase (TIGR01784 family)
MQAISNKQPPRLIIPILFYHGQEPWRYSTTGDYFKDLHPTLLQHVPDFDFIFNNLNGMSDDQIRNMTNQFLAANFLAMKHFYDQEWLVNNLRTLFSEFIEGKSKLNSQFYVYVFNFVKLKKQEIMELLSTMPTTQTTEILSTYDQAIQEGLIKGRQEGRQEGKQENLVEVVVGCWNNKLELDLIASITKLTVDQVKAILVANQLI